MIFIVFVVRPASMSMTSSKSLNLTSAHPADDFLGSGCCAESFLEQNGGSVNTFVIVTARMSGPG